MLQSQASQLYCCDTQMLALSYTHTHSDHQKKSPFPFILPLLLSSWLASSVSEVSGCEARGWGFNSPLCISEQPTCVALSKLCDPREPPEEGNGKSLLSILYLENPGKSHNKSELILVDDDDAPCQGRGIISSRCHCCHLCLSLVWIPKWLAGRPLGRFHSPISLA